MIKELHKYYSSKFNEYGHDERSLGWSKKKQNIRFFNLIRFLNLTNSSILDVGCGFADLLTYINNNKIDIESYHGIDLMDEFVIIAKSNHPNFAKNIIQKDFETFIEELNRTFDYIVASGIFGFKLKENDDDIYTHIDTIFSKSLNHANIAVSFDFISDKVDFTTSKTDFHANPSRVLDIAYKFSKNVILNNSSLPFEFTITIFKDDSFKTSTTTFNQFLIDHKQFENND